MVEEPQIRARHEGHHGRLPRRRRRSHTTSRVPRRCRPGSTPADGAAFRRVGRFGLRTSFPRLSGRARDPGPAVWLRRPCRRAPGVGPAGRRHADAQRDVGAAADGDGEPEVHEAPAQHGQGGDVLRDAERHQQGAGRRFDDAQAAGRDGNGAQHIGDAVRREQLDRVDEMAEGGHEGPQRCRVEEPVERGPQQRPVADVAVLGQLHDRVADLPDQSLQAVGSHPGNAPAHGSHGPHRPLSAGREGVCQHGRPEQREQAYQRGDHVDGVEAGEGDRYEQRHPQHDVEHDGRPDGLGRHGEARVGPFHALGGEQAIADSGSSGRPPRDDMGDGRGGQDDPDDREEPGATTGQERAGQSARS